MTDTVSERSDARTLLLDDEHPWPGLNAFTEANAAFFFGREQEVEDLARMVRQETVTVLYGKSGLGKSSLLRAGLAPLLGENQFVPVYIRLNHFEETLPLEDQVEVDLEGVIAAENIEAPQAIREETLWEYFHKKGSDWWGKDNELLKPVLIFDQFEELLTTGQETPVRAQRSLAFLAELEDLVENRPPAKLLERFKAERGLAKNYDLERVDYRVVLAVREDYLADFEGLRERLRQIMLNRYRLLPMNGEQALNVVLKPGSHLVDQDAALRIVDFVSASNPAPHDVEISREDIAQRQVEPALLSVVLRELNNRRIKAGDDKISADIVANSKPAEILSNFYERGLEGLGGAVREFIERRLLTASGARNRVAEEDAVSRYGIAESDIAALIDRRIIQRDSAGQMKWLELTHDSLAEVVRDSRTISRQRREIEEAEAREKEARQKLTKTRRLAGSFAVLAVLAVAASLFAYQKNRQLVGLAEEHTQRAIASIRQEIRDQAPGNGERVSAYLAEVTENAEAFGSDKLKAGLLLANALAAEKYYANGLIAEGIATAGESARLLDALGDDAATDGINQLTDARVDYVTGLGLAATGDLSAAESHLLAALESTQQLIESGTAENPGETHRLRALVKIALGKLQMDHGRFVESIASFEQVDAWRVETQTPIDEETRGIWQIQVLLGLGRAQDSEVDAVKYFRRAQDVVQDKIEQYPHNFVWRQLDAELAHYSTFKSMDTAGFHDVAKASRDAVGKSKTLYALDNSNLAWALIHAQSLRILGLLHNKAGDKEKERRGFEQMLEITTTINAQQPDWIHASYTHAVAKYQLGDLEESPSAFDDSRDALTAIAKSSQLYEYHRSLAFQLAIIGHELGNRDEEPDYDLALEEFQGAMDAMLSIPEQVRDRPHYKSMTAWIHALKGWVSNRQGDDESAAREFTRAMELQQELIAANNDPGAYAEKAKNLLWLGDLKARAGNSEAATEYYASALDTINLGLAAHPYNEILVEQKIRDYWHILDKYRLYGDWEASASMLDELAATATQAFEQDPVQVDLFQLLPSIKSYSEAYADNIESEIEEFDSPIHVPDDIAGLKSRIVAAAAQIDSSRLVLPAHSGPLEGQYLDVHAAQKSRLGHLVPGSWRLLSEKELALEKQSGDIRKVIAELANNQFDETNILRIYSLPLTFYTNGTLYQADVALQDGSEGAFDYMRHPDGIVHLNGLSDPIHNFNDSGALSLETWPQASAYLHFFEAGHQDEYGTYRIVQSLGDMPLTPDQNLHDLEYLDRLMVPIRVKPSKEGAWDLLGPIKWDNALYIALLRLHADGRVNILQGSPIATALPVYWERYVNGVRRLTDLDFTGTDWATALIRQWGSMVEILESDAEDKAEQLRGQYLGLSWYQLHTREFAGALASVEEGYKWNPDYLPLDTNKAHALLFLGRSDEADEIYLRNIGQEVLDKTWRQAILDDFDDFEEAGIVNEEFARVRELINNAGAE